MTQKLPVLGRAVVTRLDASKGNVRGWEMTLRSYGEYDESIINGIADCMLKQRHIVARTHVVDGPEGKTIVGFSLEDTSPPSGETPSVEISAVSPQPQSELTGGT